MLESLPSPFSFFDVMERWPVDAIVDDRTIKSVILKLRNNGVIERAGTLQDKRMPTYRRAEIISPSLSAYEEKWRAFKVANGIA